VGKTGPKWLEGQKAFPSSLSCGIGRGAALQGLSPILLETRALFPPGKLVVSRKKSFVFGTRKAGQGKKRLFPARPSISEGKFSFPGHGGPVFRKGAFEPALLPLCGEPLPRFRRRKTRTLTLFPRSSFPFPLAAARPKANFLLRFFPLVKGREPPVQRLHSGLFFSTSPTSRGGRNGPARFKKGPGTQNSRPQISSGLGGTFFPGGDGKSCSIFRKKERRGRFGPAKKPEPGWGPGPPRPWPGGKTLPPKITAGGFGPESGPFSNANPQPRLPPKKNRGERNKKKARKWGGVGRSFFWWQPGGAFHSKP